MNNEGKQSFWDEIKSWFENEFGGNTQDIDARLGRIEKHIRSIDRKVTHVSVNVDELNKDLNRLADGYVALKNENDALKQALNDADAAQAQAVADALAASDADAQAKIDAADAIVENVSPEPVATPPADGGDGSAPVDGGGDTAPAGGGTGGAGDGSGDAPSA